MATIVDQLAQSIGSSAAQLLAGKMSSSELDRLRNSITQKLANALSPPSNAPPGTAAEQAAALAARLQRVVESIARDAQNGIGQQNELSGNILDANSAKELPAQTQTNGTSSTLDVSSLVSSLLSSVIAALNAPASTTPAKPSYSPVQLATAQSLTSAATQAQLGAPSPLESGLLGQSTANAVASQAPPAPQTSISMSNAPDLLARMLVRAAGVDAQLNASGTPADASDASGGASALAAPAGSTSLSPTMLAARFAALLADLDGTAVASSSSSGDTSTNTGSGHSFGQDLTQQSPTGTTAASLLAAPAANLTTQVQNALQTSSHTPVDTSAVLEQMVKGMTMRTLAQGTSEIRLQLQPQNLGQLTMRLTVTGNQVSANVVAQNADVQTALVANHQDLARSLSEAGLTLTGFSVDVSGGDAGQDQSKDRTAGFGRRYIVHELGGQPTAETTEASNLGPSLLGGSSLDLFNSLA
ncbi:MAG TPA: flagellar hook-length control protein FliK [Alphaproteobacteria bacterium]|nr:flagellar hook-length control protein FliK [Alphaproteobacteria bacterium]